MEVKMATKSTKPEESAPVEERLRGSVYDISRKVLLAGIGAMVLAQDEVISFVNRLVERGELAEKDARKLLREIMERREKLEHEKAVEKTTHPAAATKADVETLMARIDELNKKLEEMKK
jgi:polyhydroxyalkanoate synthesis regulator phasin